MRGGPPRLLRMMGLASLRGRPPARLPRAGMLLSMLWKQQCCARPASFPGRRPRAACAHTRRTGSASKELLLLILLVLLLLARLLLRPLLPLRGWCCRCWDDCCW